MLPTSTYSKHFSQTIRRLSMSSTTIYCHPLPSNKIFSGDLKIRKEGSYEPFVYVVREKSSGKKYIGSRTAVNCMLTDMGSRYFTSSKYVKEIWEEDLSSFEVIEIYPCESNHSALILEEILIKEKDAVFNDEYYNLGFAGVLYNKSGTKITDDHKRIISESNKGKIKSTETKTKMSEAQKFKVNVLDLETNQTLRCFVDDPNYVSGRYQHINPNKGRPIRDHVKTAIVEANTGKVVVRDTETNQILKCDVDNINYVSGRYIHVNKGLERTEEFKQNVSDYGKGKVNVRDTVTGKTFKCLIDDPNYTSGRYIPANTGTFTHSNETKQNLSDKKKGTVGVIDTETGETFRCSVDHAYYLSGRYQHLSKGWTTVVDIETGEKIRCRIDDEKYKSERYVNRQKFVKKKRTKCIHCGHESTLAAIKRFHNDNCKYKIDDNTNTLF